MGKISSYGTVSSPSLSDMLIGTDVADSNATKNFTIGEVLSLLDTSVFVPYTDAAGDVYLTPYGLRAQYINTVTELSFDGNPGEPGQVAMSNGSETAPSWVYPADFDSYKGSFYDSLTQTLTGGAGVAVPVILRQTDVFATNGISVVTDGTHLTRITVANAGVYNLLFSAQLTNSGGSGQTVDFWLRKNGSTAAENIADTNGKVHLQSGANYLMAAWNYFVSLEAGDYIQLMWTATSTNITMVTEAANGVHPATPSIIVTLNKV